MKKFLSKAAFVGSLGIAGLAAPTLTNAACNGNFINPMTDVCWSCVMPITIAGFPVDYTGGKQRDMTSAPNDFVCSCGTDIGVPLGFFEPARMVDVTHNAYCMVGLGGVSLGESGITGWDTNGYVSKDNTVNAQESAFYQAHLYANPLLYVLGLLLDSPCVEQAGYDIAYITEADPTWNDAELANLMSPDSFLYGSLPAVMACGADCIMATTNMPSTLMHWCVGCQGTMYPFMGAISHHASTIDSSSLVMTRLMAKMHRQGGSFGYYGKSGFCGGFIQPVMNKQQYKYSMTYPIPQTRGVGTSCCQPLGATTWIWGAGRYFPVEGEQYNFMLYRKRDCCQSVYEAGN